MYVFNVKHIYSMNSDFTLIFFFKNRRKSTCLGPKWPDMTSEQQTKWFPAEKVDSGHVLEISFFFVICFQRKIPYNRVLVFYVENIHKKMNSSKSPEKYLFGSKMA